MKKKASICPLFVPRDVVGDGVVHANREKEKKKMLLEHCDAFSPRCSSHTHTQKKKRVRDQSGHNLSHSSGETFFMHQSPVKLMTSPPLNKQTKRKELKEGKIKKKEYIPSFRRSGGKTACGRKIWHF